MAVPRSLYSSPSSDPELCEGGVAVVEGVVDHYRYGKLSGLEAVVHGVASIARNRKYM
jgi:hypothetical protein